MVVMLTYSAKKLNASDDDPKNATLPSAIISTLQIGITQLSHSYHTVITQLSHSYHTVITQLSHSYRTVITHTTV